MARFLCSIVVYLHIIWDSLFSEKDNGKKWFFKCLVQFHTFSQSPVSHGNSNFSPLRVDGAIFILEIPPLLHRCSASGPRPTREHIAARVLPERIGTLLDRRGVENGVRIIELSSLLSLLWHSWLNFYHRFAPLNSLPLRARRGRSYKRKVGHPTWEKDPKNDYC